MTRTVRLLACFGAVVIALALLAFVAPAVHAQSPTARDVSLAAGWNLISLPLAPTSSEPGTVFASIAGKYTLVYAYDPANPSSPWRKYSPAVPAFANTLTAVSEEMGLWIHTTQAATLTVSGTVVESSSIPLRAGWNLIGYPLEQTLPITLALASIADQYDQVYAFDALDTADPWKLYDPDQLPFLNDLTQMEPGLGYWLHATADCTLTLPPPLPDLVVSGISTEPSSLYTNVNFTVIVTVTNQGAGAAYAPFRVDWYADLASPPVTETLGTGYWDVPSLAPGASVVLTATHAFATTGDHTVYAQVDTTDALMEVNEANNVGGPLTKNVATNEISFCGTISANTTWYTGMTYIITCDSTVNSGITLSVQPGLLVKFNSQKGLTVNGTMLALGTTSQPIIFTANTTTPTAGYWKGLTFGSASRGNRIQHGVVEYAGYNSNGAIRSNGGMIAVTDSTVRLSSNYGIYANGGGLTVTGCTVQQNGSYGLYATSMVTPTVTSTTFISNSSYAAYVSLTNGMFSGGDNSGSGNGTNGIALIGSIGTDTALDVNSIPYVLTESDLTINSGITLTIPAGVVIKGSGTASQLFVNGTLVVQGTASSQVYFTSVKDDSVGGDTNNDANAMEPMPGDWGNIQLNAGARGILDYAVLRYGGSSGFSYSPTNLLAVFQYADALLRHSTVSHSGDVGILASTWSSGSTSVLTITLESCVISNNADIGIEVVAGTYGGSHRLFVNDSTIAHNGGDGIYINRVGAFQLVGSRVHGNAGYGVRNDSTSIFVNAQNNWWGSDSGPAPYGSGNGINYRTCYDSVKKVNYICQYYVDADPWLGQGVFAQSQLGQSGPAATYQAHVAEPVNTANGNYSTARTDLSIPTRGLPLDFTRAYNALNPQSGPLGWGWTHTWHLRLAEQAADKSVSITFADGHAEKWNWTGSAYDGAPGVFGILVKNGDSSFDLTQKDQTVYHFSPDGKLAWAEDRNANRTSLAYDGDGRLTTVTEPAGRALTLSYTSPISTALVSQVTDPASRTVGFTYNITGELTAVTDVMGQTTTMAYDGNHRLLTITDANSHRFVRNVYDASGRVSEQYDALNNKTIFAYDEPAHKTLVTDPRNFVTTYQYDGDWRLTSEKDPLNFTASYAYDADSNRIQITDKRGNATYLAHDDRGNTLVITDTLSGIRSYTWDTRNNLLSETDPLNHTTAYEYDARSNLTRLTDALSHVTEWTYDAFGQMLSTTDARSHTTSYGYDAWGNRTVITDTFGGVTGFTHDIAGRRLTETDALGRTVTYTYDAANRPLTVSEPLGKVTQYGYDAVGNRIAITDALGGVTAFTYDAKDRLAIATDPLGHTTSYAYDSVDNQTVVTDSLGHATTYTYDAMNRRTSVQDSLNHTTSYQYDANGNRTRLTDANGKATNYVYDTLNRLTSVTDAASGTVTYAYDAVGNRTGMTDANSHTTTYAYDALNRLTSITDPLSQVVSYAYDAVGNRTSQTKADSTVISHTYDPLSRLVETTYPGSAIQYEYNAVGNRTAMTDTLGVTTYTYDDLDRLTAVAGPTGTLQYAYDLNNNRTNLTYPDSKTVAYAYDAANRLTTVTDWASRVTTYSYDNANRLTATQYPNGVQATHTYDNADRLLSLVHTSPVSGTIATATYTLDNVGNRLTMQDLDGTTTYAYDNLYRLSSVTYPSSEGVTYAYDPMGNRTAMTSTVTGTVAYTYDAGDRLQSAGPITFTWDANGNMIGKGSATYTFDALDRLTEVVSGTTTVQFSYNGDGVRLGKTVDGVNTAYAQDVQSSLPTVLAETTSGQTNLYVYGNDLLLQENPAGTPTFHHADGLGSTRALTNAAGQSTDTYAYDTFGAERSHSGSVAQPFTFIGEQTDEELGLVFLRARYYDPEMGRFVTKDQFEGFRDGTQTRNRYVYVENNPVGRIDPTGLTWQIFGGIEGGFMLGPIKIGGGAKTVLELTGGLPDVYLSGSGGVKGGIGLDASLGPKVGIAYEGSGGISYLPDWLQIKGGKIKLPFVEVGGTVTREKFKFEAALRTGVGFAFEPQIGIEAKGKTGNLKGKLGDWLFDMFVQPGFDAEYNRIMAQNRGYSVGGGGGSWGDPPSSGK